MDDYSYSFDEMTRQWVNEERIAIQLGITDAQREELARKRKEAEESVEHN